MGRKRKAGTTVVAQCGNRVLAWVDGSFSGDADFLALVRQAIAEKRIFWMGKPIVSAADNPEGVAAAMLLVKKSQIVEAPPEVMRLVELRKSVIRTHYV
jgi:hypothetical protein